MPSTRRTARCHFESRDQHLYLWNGHRFHEQPSRSFVAVERVATDDLVTEVPRLPARLEGCFDYHPDHIALTARGLSGTPRLRIDFPLWRTLCRLARGLPRKLIPERDIHRLDAFLQKLGAEHGRRARFTVWSVHLENLELIQVNLSAEQKPLRAGTPLWLGQSRTTAQRKADTAALAPRARGHPRLSALPDEACSLRHEFSSGVDRPLLPARIPEQGVGAEDGAQGQAKLFRTNIPPTGFIRCWSNAALWIRRSIWRRSARCGRT